MHSRPISTIGSRFDESNNAITPLRLILALVVIAFHAWPIGGFGADPAQILSSGQAAGGGTLAVLAFFGLSGFLLGGSRTRLTPLAFLWRRALRILPAYWVCIALASLFVGLPYFAQTWWLAGDVGSIKSSVLAGAPYGEQVNAPIWTLWPEIICYVVLALTPRRYLIVAAPALIAFSIAAYLIIPLPEFMLATAFFLGTSMRLFKRLIPLNGGLVLACLALFAIASALGHYNLVAPVAMTYVAIWLAVFLPLRWSTDLSYGTYIYAFPLAQGLALTGLPQFGLLPFLALSAAITLPVAAASWYLIERPALSLKRLRARSVSRLLLSPDRISVPSGD